MLSGPHPQSPQDVQYWLEHYHEWQEAMQTGRHGSGDSNTTVTSGRVGRPTETAAVYQADLSECCLVVDRWLDRLGPVKWWMAQKYIGGLTARGIARQLDLPYGEVASLIRILPTLIYLDWYGNVDTVLNTK